ncbi:MAG: ABC transporter substrate-binding protein [Geminicoccaceae bacterium]
MQYALKLGAAAACAAAIVLTGCGGGSDSSSGHASRGGTVTVMDVAGGIDSLDPGYWYYQEDNTEMAQPAQRALYGWPPAARTPVPDLASDMPRLSDGGKKLTISLKRGIHYSPPLQRREVQADDLRYAIERCFKPAVGNGYANVYYSDLVGASAFQTGKAQTITGIATPDSHTLVLRTTKPVGVLATANALTMPCTIPIPRSYAAKYDHGSVFHYGEHQVFTGPYMIQGAGSGTVPKSGYLPERLLVLVRNPSWDPKTDFRHAYFDKIIAKGGNDVSVASRAILAGQSMVSGDYAAPPTAVLKTALQSSRRKQLTIKPSQSIRYIAFNTTVKPLDNVNLRRAIIAATNKVALRTTRGGPAIGVIATHMIPPQMPGFQAAGGTGATVDFEQHPGGDLALAMKYMRAAGYPSGKYTGAPLLMVADAQDPAAKTAEAFRAQLAALGIRTQYHEAPHTTMLTKFCTVPKAAVAICPSMGWGKDFYDSQSIMGPLFDGRNIVPSGNTNSAQVNDPAMNAALARTAQVADPAARAQAYAALDRQATSQAFYDPWLWDNQVELASANVRVVWNDFNDAIDLTASSLK